MFAKACCLDAEKLESDRKEFAAMEAARVIGVICPTPDRYPLPNVADFTSRLKGCKVFTKLDLTKGYYQVPMAPGDKPFSHFEWVRMPFGLRNAGCTFQHLMDQILGDLPHCFVYVDDILISSPDIMSHLQHFCQVLV